MALLGRVLGLVAVLSCCRSGVLPERYPGGRLNARAGSFALLTIIQPASPASELNDALQILMLTRPVVQPPHEVEKNCNAVEQRITNALKLMKAD